LQQDQAIPAFLVRMICFPDPLDDWWSMRAKGYFWARSMRGKSQKVISHYWKKKGFGKGSPCWRPQYIFLTRMSIVKLYVQSHRCASTIVYLALGWSHFSCTADMSLPAPAVAARPRLRPDPGLRADLLVFFWISTSLPIMCQVSRWPR
jgi:hypothetical protein